MRALTKQYKLVLVEDAAHGIGGRYKDRFLGSMGDVAAFSFHETKNIISGEGGALLINDEEMVERAEIIWEKGTNRTKFFRGEIDKYTWVDVGSSFLPSELNAAFLWAQFEHLKESQDRRNFLWKRYNEGLKDIKGLDLPQHPEDIIHNSYIFHVILPNGEMRDGLMKHLKTLGILAVFHYISLHSSPVGHSLGYREGELPITEDMSKRLLRLPLFHTLKEKEQNEVIEGVRQYMQ